MSLPPLPDLLTGTALMEQGHPRFGQFQDSLRHLNHPSFVFTTPFGKPASAWQRWWGFKEFQFFGGIAQNLLFGCAIAHLRHTGVAFVYVRSLENGTLLSRSWRRPCGLGFQLANNPVDGESHFHARDAHIVMQYRPSPRKKYLELHVGNDLSLQATMTEDAFQPLSLCTRTGYTGWTYTNKTAGLALAGTLRFRGQTIELSRLGMMGVHDFSCGYMRRETYWNWAALSGIAEGHSIGLNLAAGVNETGYTENALWIDGQLIKLALARFHYDPHHLDRPWRICSDDGLVDLGFTPVGSHAETINARIVGSRFQQLCGHFDGRIRAAGLTLPIRGLPGFVEDHYVKW